MRKRPLWTEEGNSHQCRVCHAAPPRRSWLLAHHRVKQGGGFRIKRFWEDVWRVRTGAACYNAAMHRAAIRQHRRVPIRAAERGCVKHGRGGLGRAHAPQERSAKPPTAAPSGMKLLWIVVGDTDADGLVRAMVTRGYAATKVGSTGGFLRRGNSVILSGVEAAAVEEVLTLVRQLCPPRTELLAMSAIPVGGDLPFLNEPIEVRAGGAVVFVVAVERFVRL